MIAAVEQNPGLDQPMRVALVHTMCRGVVLGDKAHPNRNAELLVQGDVVNSRRGCLILLHMFASNNSRVCHLTKAAVPQDGSCSFR